jgi:hypothetical protein
MLALPSPSETFFKWLKQVFAEDGFRNIRALVHQRSGFFSVEHCVGLDKLMSRNAALGSGSD